MANLPYASTDVCPSCGAETQQNRYQFSMVETPAWTDIHTGNLCEGCYQKIVDFIDAGSNGTLE